MSCSDWPLYSEEVLQLWCYLDLKPTSGQSIHAVSKVELQLIAIVTKTRRKAIFNWYDIRFIPSNLIPRPSLPALNVAHWKRGPGDEAVLLYPVHTSSDSLASISVLRSSSFWRMFSTVLRSSFLTASIRPYMHIKMNIVTHIVHSTFSSLFRIKQLWCL